MKNVSKSPMYTAKIGYLIISAVLCVLGIFLIFKPDFSLNVFAVICGILLLVFGVVKVIGYFSKDIYRLAFQYDLAFGILLGVLGILMLVNPSGLSKLIGIVLGAVFLTDGLFKIQISLDSKKFGIGKWWMILVLALIAAGFGLAALLNPHAGSRILMVLLGASMFFEGMLNIFTVLAAVKILKDNRPADYETDYKGEN